MERLTFQVRLEPSGMFDQVEVPQEECLDRPTLVAEQSRRLGDLLESIYGRNRFYTRKLDEAGLSPGRLEFPRDLARLPTTTKDELVTDQAAEPPWGTALTEPVHRYTRYCQTSSTTGRPLRWIDTTESWQWVVDCWKAVYRAARVGPADRIFFPFSFGPFLGFWSAFDAGWQIGAHVVPAGGMSSQLRLATMFTVRATAVCCTPTYALRLAEVGCLSRVARRCRRAASASSSWPGSRAEASLRHANGLRRRGALESSITTG
jgi:phenylacetate-CoA ligase